MSEKMNSAGKGDTSVSSETPDGIEPQKRKVCIPGKNWGLLLRKRRSLLWQTAKRTPMA